VPSLESLLEPVGFDEMGDGALAELLVMWAGPAPHAERAVASREVSYPRN